MKKYMQCIENLLIKTQTDWLNEKEGKEMKSNVFVVLMSILSRQLWEWNVNIILLSTMTL